MLTAMLGTKLGMTQYIQEDGIVVAVTAVEVGPCTVTQIKTDATDGYEAVQIGFRTVPERKLQRPRRGHLQKHNLDPFLHLREVRSLPESDLSIGETLRVDQVFSANEEVDIVGTSKGKGFAGGVKRWHFRGGPKSHGQGDRWRAPGSIGAGTTPGRVVKGYKMAGQMGNKRVTQKRGVVVAIDSERNVLFVRGPVPGATKNLVLVRKRVEPAR